MSRSDESTDQSSSGSSGPLEGLLVADFSRVLAGPLCTMLLADMGATVVKVERPGLGDDTRQWGPPFDTTGMSAYYSAVNRNKRSIDLDLKNPKDADRARELARRSDILVENFRHDSLAKGVIDCSLLRRSHPGLVCCHISGFGAGSDLPGYDFLVQAASGLMSLTGSPESGPMKLGAPVVDVVTGLYATIGILAAIQERTRSGLGQEVRVDLMTSALATLVNHASSFLMTGEVSRPMGDRHPNIAPYEMVRTATDSIAIAAGNDSQFHRLCVALDVHDLSTDARVSTNEARVANRQFLIDAIESATSHIPTSALVERLREEGIPCASVHTVEQAFEFAEQEGLQPVVETNGVKSVANPITFSRTPVRYHMAPPSLAADAPEIRTWLDTHVSQLKEAKPLGSARGIRSDEHYTHKQGNTSDLENDIQSLQSLRAARVLTAEEFERIRQRLLRTDRPL